MEDGKGSGWVRFTAALQGVMSLYQYRLRSWYFSWISFWQLHTKGW